MCSQIALALAFVLTSAQAESCPAGWPRAESVSSLEKLVANSVEQAPFELLDFRGEGRILIFDFEDRVEQNRMFDGASTFIESADDPGRPGAGQGMSDYDGHNLLTASLARYFRSREEAEAPGGSVLSSPEQRLRDGLLCLGLLLRVDGVLVGKPRTAVLAANHDPTLRDARSAIVSHELYHGLDMTEAEHWRATSENWESLRAAQKRTWKKLVLGQRRYDASDPSLIVAEVGAYSGMFGLEKILRLRQNRDLHALERSELEELRRGRSFEGILEGLAFDDPTFLFEMEYGFTALPVSGDGPRVFVRPDLPAKVTLLPSGAAALGALFPAALDPAIVVDCGTCRKPARLGWLLFQIELLVARSDEKLSQQALEDWRLMKRTERESYTRLFSASGGEPSPETLAVMARSAELAAKRSGVRPGSDLSGLPPSAAQILLAARRSVDSRYGPRTRTPERGPRP